MEGSIQKYGFQHIHNVTGATPSHGRTHGEGSEAQQLVKRLSRVYISNPDKGL